MQNVNQQKEWHETMNRIKLYCLPYAGGSRYIYKSWVKTYSKTTEIIPIDYSGHGDMYGEPFYESSEEAVTGLIDS